MSGMLGCFSTLITLFMGLPLWHATAAEPNRVLRGGGDVVVKTEGQTLSIDDPLAGVVRRLVKPGQDCEPFPVIYTLLCTGTYGEPGAMVAAGISQLLMGPKGGMWPFTGEGRVSIINDDTEVTELTRSPEIAETFSTLIECLEQLGNVRGVPTGPDPYRACVMFILVHIPGLRQLGSLPDVRQLGSLPDLDEASLSECAKSNFVQACSCVIQSGRQDILQLMRSISHLTQLSIVAKSSQLPQDLMHSFDERVRSQLARGGR